MKTKKKLSFYVLLSFIFCIFYIILAAKPLNTEYEFSPVWKIDISSPQNKEFAETDKLFRKLLHVL